MASSPSVIGGTVRVLLNGGDNMLGRAVQLSFPVQAPGEEDIWDSCPASHYLTMCMHPSGGKKEPTLEEIREMNLKGSYLWGDFLNLSILPPPDVRILNLETAVTQSINNDDVPKWKGIRYHFHVGNLEPAMRVIAEETHGSAEASPLIVSFANNHCMDYGRKAFETESLPALLETSLFQTVGCGRNWSEAAKPVIASSGDKTVEIFAFSTGCSGTPDEWWASKDRSGLVGLPGLYDMRSVEQAVNIAKKVLSGQDHLASPVDRRRLRIFSIHWGPNWAMKGESKDQLSARREFAHRLIDECSVDIIYGHSSHHVRGMELYKGKLVLYGTGDMINDYEGFENPGEDRYNRLGGLYLVDMNAKTGQFQKLRIVPMFMNRLKLERYTKSSKIWKPNAKRLEVDSSKSEDFCKFINKLSRLDAGAVTDVPGSPIVLEHLDSDPEIPGGPVLISK